MVLPYEIPSGGFDGVGGGVRMEPGAGAAHQVRGARHTRRGGGRQRKLHRGRDADVLQRRQRGGRGNCDHAGGRRGGVFELRVWRRSADSGAHEGRQGPRDRGRGHHARPRDGGFLPQSCAQCPGDQGPAGAARIEGLGSDGRHSFRAGSGDGGRGAGDAEGVWHEVVRGSGAAGHRTGGWLSDR